MAHDTIEIYVRDLSEDDAVGWLRAVFEEVEQVREQPIVTYEGVYEGTTIPVQITECVKGGAYTSLWFNAPGGPWDSVRDCVRAAHDAFETEALCYLNRPDEPWTLYRMVNGEEEYVDERALDDL